jgi:hypothetical protein
MDASIERTGTVEGLERVLEETSARPGTEGILLLTCDANGYEPNRLDPVLERVPVPLAGALFPSIFSGTELLQRGSIAISLPKRPHILTFDSAHEDPDLARKRIESCDLESLSTMVVLTDGLAFNPTPLLDALFDMFGLEVKYVGGGAGSLTLERRPCLMTNEGFTQGGAVVAALDLDCGVGVAHGHLWVAGPHQITRATGHLVHSIDWRPAVDHFNELIDQHLPAGDNDSGGVVSRNFCLAINRLDGDCVVREAVRSRPDGSLEFATEMRENELVDLVRADRDKMLTAAPAAKAAAANDLNATAQTNLCFTCCARQMFLGDDFDKEVRSLAGEAPAIGAITVGGEIANNGESYLDYYNRTCVVGAFGV